MIVSEPGLQRDDGGTRYPNLHVSPFIGSGGSTAPVVGYSRASGERDAPIYDQGLAMRAVVETPDCVPSNRLYQAT